MKMYRSREIVCDFTTSKIYIEYKKCYGMPFRKYTIDMSGTRTIQRVFATWTLVLATAEFEVVSMDIKFIIGDEKDRDRYCKIINSVKEKVFENMFGKGFTCWKPDNGDMDTIIVWHVSKGLNLHHDRTNGDRSLAYSIVNSIDIDLSKYNCDDDNKEPYNQFVLQIDHRDARDAFEFCISPITISYPMEGLFLSIRYYNGGAISKLYKYNDMVVLITPFDIYYEDLDISNKTNPRQWIPIDTDDIISCRGFLCAMSDAIRKLNETKNPDFNIDECRERFYSKYNIKND